MDLDNEIIEIQLLVDELEHQGIRYDAELLYANLLKSVSGLMRKGNPELHTVLQLPITIYRMKPHDEAKDGYKFMDLLRTISDNIMYDSEWESLRIKKAKTTAIVASVADEGKKKTGKRFTKATDIKP